MAVETAKDKIRLSELIGQKQEMLNIDGDVIVNDIKPDVLKVINTNGTLCIYKKEVLNGKIKLEGCVNTYIIYLADDENNSIRTINTSLDFAEFIDMENCTEEMTLEDNIYIKGFETKVLNGRKLHVRAFLDASIKVYLNNEIEAIVDINDNEEDIQMLNSNKNVMSLLGENSSKTVLKDTINLKHEDELAEIMRVDFSISDIETKTSYNKILSKADADVNIMYLTEDNRIKSIRSLIPIMGFVEMPNISENCMCQAKNRLKNVVIKPNNIDEHSIYVEIEIELTCYAYETKDIDIVKDLYSLTSNMNFNKQEINAMTDKKETKAICNIREELNISELQNEKIHGMTTRINLTKQIPRRDKVIYEGEVGVEILFSNNSMESKNINLPLNFEANVEGVNENSKIETAVKVKNEDLVVRENGNVTTNIELEFIIEFVNTKPINVINEVAMEENKQNDIYSMVIYFVKPGDTLWKIAKKFRSRVEDIARVNNIEDENLIKSGQQLYIPKCARRNIAV